MKPRRYAALFQACPKCGADVGIPCEGSRGERRSVHQERLSGVGAKEVNKVKSQRIAAKFREKGFYASEEWRALRYRALRLHGGSCQCCGSRAAPGRPLHVDHIKPRSRFPELELELSNLQVLCGDCNVGKGASDSIDWRLPGVVMQ